MDFDLLVVGGGINGAGIARDAAGRGIARVAGRTGRPGGTHFVGEYEAYSWRPALPRILRIRPGAKALREREVLLRAAPHLIRPLRFVMPHMPNLRPAWMIRLGCFSMTPWPARIIATRRVESTASPCGRRSLGRFDPPRLRLFRCVGRRCPPGGLERTRGTTGWRHHHDAHLFESAPRATGTRGTRNCSSARARRSPSTRAPS